MRKILKFFLYLIIAFVCLVILQFAYSKYEDFKNPPPTPEERIKTKERNERLNSCLDDNIKYYSSYDNYDQRYWKCYGEMTNAHKARGLHESNRELSIRIKEGICDAYAKGEELNYEGKR